MSSCSMRTLALWVCAAAWLTGCTPPSSDEPRRLAPVARRLLIGEGDLGPQAQELLANLKSDPYVYFRFINRAWARATCDALGEDLAARTFVHLHGDAHLSQYAYTRTQHGLDDLDDSIRGPAALDVVRFLGSVALAVRARGWTDSREALFDEFFAGYRAALMIEAYEPPLPSYVARMREALESGPGDLKFLEWADSLVEPIEDLDNGGIEAGRQRLAELIATERPELPPFYLEPKRVGWLFMGVGSALTPKLLFRCEGLTRADEDDFLLEARELSELRDVSCVDVSQSDRAARILVGYGRIGRISHDIVVVVPAPPEPAPGAREWWARSWDSSYREIRLDDLASPEELAEVIHDSAAQLGHGHGWTPEGAPREPLRNRKLEWLERDESRIRALAVEMSEHLLDAWEEFRAPARPPDERREP